jgi:hypothetical protein
MLAIFIIKRVHIYAAIAASVLISRPLDNITHRCNEIANPNSVWTVGFNQSHHDEYLMEINRRDFGETNPQK